MAVLSSNVLVWLIISETNRLSINTLYIYRRYTVITWLCASMGDSGLQPFSFQPSTQCFIGTVYNIIKAICMVNDEGQGSFDLKINMRVY